MKRFSRDYKLFHLIIGNADYESCSAIQELPVQSAICSPLSLTDKWIGKGMHGVVEELAYQELISVDGARQKCQVHI